jgi:predicted methyltransferase
MRESNERRLQRRYRTRVAIVALLAVATVVGLGAIFNAIQTLSRLEQVERERDLWQRSAEVIQELGLQKGCVVVDLGSGVGYFSLKLSSEVGKSGKVLAVDIRKYPLYMLRARAFLGGRGNIDTILGAPDDPHLPPLRVDAVLVANTYHELTAPKAILAHLFQSLRPDGRMVIVDRVPKSDRGESRESEVLHHEIAPQEVEAELLASGFEVVRRDNKFIERANESHFWWLIVVRKP